MNKSSSQRLPVLIAVFIPVVLGFFVTHCFGEEALVGINSSDKKVKEEMRDPFWPVGFVPVQESKEHAAVVELPVIVGSWNKAMKTIVINGVSSRGDNNFFAVINGNIKSVGDTISVKLGGVVYLWEVDSIKPPKSVKLRRVSAQ